MFNDPEFKKDWRAIVTHDSANICGFFGEYRWLSNFELTPCSYQCIAYPSAENAYQAAKVVSIHRDAFRTCTPAQAKRLWKNPKFIRSTKTEEGWNEARHDIMLGIVVSKFLNNPQLKEKLIETGHKYIEETNWWKDEYWGVCDGRGQNKLGKILTHVRAFWT